MKNVAVLLFFLSLAACANPHPVSIDKFFNVEDFPGLTALGRSYQEVRLDYSLDNDSGNLEHFSSCTDVDETSAEAIVPSQYPLFRLLQLNCKAAELYHQASEASQTYLPKDLSSAFLQSLPAFAAPNLGGESLEGKSGTLGSTHPDLIITEVGVNSANVAFDDLDVSYVVLARGDFDHDGIEDMLIRLDWRITSAFGNGFDLLVMSKNESDIDVQQRY